MPLVKTVGIDPVHTSFLHRFFDDEDPSQGYGKLFRDTSRDSDMPMSRIMREFTRPRIEVVRTIMLNHWYHHRGQLSVYLRLLEVPVPVIYGRSADEDPFA